MFVTNGLCKQDIKYILTLYAVVGDSGSLMLEPVPSPGGWNRSHTGLWLLWLGAFFAKRLFEKRDEQTSRERKTKEESWSKETFCSTSKLSKLWSFRGYWRMVSPPPVSWGPCSAPKDARPGGKMYENVEGVLLPSLRFIGWLYRLPKKIVLATIVFAYVSFYQWYPMVILGATYVIQFL